MQTNEFIAINDKPALLAVSNPDWMVASHKALDALGFRVHQAAAHPDFITNFEQNSYHVSIIEECFASNSIYENRSLEYLQNAPMSVRRFCTIILVGDSFISFNTMQALCLGVHLVVNRSEISIFHQFLEKIIAENEAFMTPYREAQRRLTHVGT